MVELALIYNAKHRLNNNEYSFSSGTWVDCQNCITCMSSPIFELNVTATAVKESLKFPNTELS